MSISEEIRVKLIAKGASLVGFADLCDVPGHSRKGFRYGIQSE